MRKLAANSSLATKRDLPNRLYKEDQIARLGRIRQAKNEYIKYLIIEEDRIDILAELVDKRFDDFHEILIDHQAGSITTLQLAPRGWGKSTVGTVLSCAHELLKDRDARILFASETSTQACNFLGELKAILTHDNIVEIFGDLKGDMWHENAINIKGRYTARKESSVMTTGVDGAITSAHFEIIYCDDLVTLKNSRTAASRDKVMEWFRTTLLPCVIDENTKIRMVGTRYHPEDLYDDLMTRDPKFKNSTQIVPALNPETGESNNPAIFSMEFLQETKDSMGVIAFDSQYNQDPSGVQGVIFDADDFRYYKNKPKNLVIFQGVDLAVEDKSQNDKFAITTIGVDPRSYKIYLIDYVAKKLSPNKQDELIYEKWDRYKAIRVGIESNAYQKTKILTLGEDPLYSLIPAVPMPTDKDKITRAQMLSVRFERGDILFPEEERDGEIAKHLLSFPNGRYDDLFDSLEIAVQTAFRSRRKKSKRRKKEPGVIGSRGSKFRRKESKIIGFQKRRK
jgi:predicted phage terminase large subunit-like protein